MGRSQFRGKAKGGSGISVGGDTGVNGFPIPISETAKRSIPEPFSLLNFLGIDSTTYVRALIDTSGSMDSSIPIIDVAIEDLKEILKTNIWNGDQAKLDKYFDRVGRNNEDWVDWITEDLRDNPSEPDKTVFLIWQNEAEPDYHGSNNGDGTSILNNHINNFINIYDNKIIFKCLMFGLNTAGSSEAFQDHLWNVRHGANGVNTALTPSEYSVFMFQDIDPSIEAQFYYDAMLGKKPYL